MVSNFRIHSGIQVLKCAGRHAAFDALGKAHQSNHLFLHTQILLVNNVLAGINQGALLVKSAVQIY